MDEDFWDPKVLYYHAIPCLHNGIRRSILAYRLTALNDDETRDSGAHEQKRAKIQYLVLCRSPRNTILLFYHFQDSFGRSLDFTG